MMQIASFRCNLAEVAIRGVSYWLFVIGRGLKDYEWKFAITQ